MLLSKGIAYYSLGNHERASKNYNQAISIAYSTQKEHKRAIEDYGQAIGIASESP